MASRRAAYLVVGKFTYVAVKRGGHVRATAAGIAMAAGNYSSISACTVASVVLRVSLKPSFSAM